MLDVVVEKHIRHKELDLLDSEESTRAGEFAVSWYEAMSAEVSRGYHWPGYYLCST